MFSTAPFKSIADLIKAYPTQEICLSYIESIRWPEGKVVSPFYPSSTVYKAGEHRYKCRNSNKYFNVLTGTMFENTKIPLQTWFLAIYLITSHKRGISSYQLASDLSITQKSSWFLLSRIREAMEHKSFLTKFDGTVEMDEAYIGGKNKNRHKDKKKEGSGGRSYEDKQPVFGMLQNEVSEVVYRSHKKNPELAVKEKVVYQHAIVKTEVVQNTKGETLLPIIKEKIEQNTTVVTDEYNMYKNLNGDYDHKVVYHRLQNYVTNQGFTTNRVEGHWDRVKKVWGTTYAGRVTPKHLHRYCSEIDYRFNTRHMETGERFNLLLEGSNKRLRYIDLIKK